MPIYPMLNEAVTYARADEKGEVHTGSGKVQAIFIGNPDKKLLVQVKDGDSAWNVDLAMVNYTPEKLEEYRAAVSEVQALTDEGNEIVRKTIDEFNAKVAAVYVRVLGETFDAEPVGDLPSDGETAAE